MLLHDGRWPVENLAQLTIKEIKPYLVVSDLTIVYLAAYMIATYARYWLFFYWVVGSGVRLGER